MVRKQSQSLPAFDRNGSRCWIFFNASRMSSRSSTFLSPGSFSSALPHLFFFSSDFAGWQNPQRSFTFVPKSFAVQFLPDGLVERSGFRNFGGCG